MKRLSLSASALSSALPSPREPSVRTLYRLGKNPLEAPGSYFDQLGETFSFELLGARYVFSRDPAWFDEVLVKKAKSFHKDQTTRGLAALLGQGLLVQDGELWRERRRLSSPPFVPTEIEKLVGVFREETLRELASWRQGPPLDLHGSMARLTMKIALRALFGYQVRDGEHFETQMAAAMRYFEGIWGTQIPLPPWIPTRTNRAFRAARQHFRRFVAHLVDRPAPAGSVLGNLQQALREGRLSREDVASEAMTMLVAGHETSALSLTYLLAELGLHHALQQPIAAESSAWSETPSLRDLTSDGALHRAILEGLRLYPVAWAVGREVVEPVEIAGHTLLPKTTIGLFQWSLQRSERYFERAREFWPERWIERPPSSLPKGTFSPFGLGPRVCIGNQFALAEIAVVLGLVLREFRIETISPYPPRYRASITARPADPVLIRVRPR